MPMIKRREFAAPTSLADADERRIRLIAEIQEIQTQLGDPTSVTDFEIEAEYWSWRQKAKWALTLRLQELRFTKEWIKSRNTTSQRSA